MSVDYIYHFSSVTNQYEIKSYRYVKYKNNVFQVLKKSSSNFSHKNQSCNSRKSNVKNIQKEHTILQEYKKFTRFT